MAGDQEPMAAASFYVQLRQYGQQARLAHATQGKPVTQAGDCLLIKLTVRVPRRMFARPCPEAVITVPADLIEAMPIEVEATQP